MVVHAVKAQSTQKSKKKKSLSPKHTTVSIQEIVEKDFRMEASVFGIESRQAREDIENCKWDVTSLGDIFIQDVFHASRFKRNYIGKNNSDAVGFLGSSEILDCYPMPVKFLPEKQVAKKHLGVEKNWVLISCSGTIGNVSYVNHTISKYAVSQHVIRIIPTCYSGYIYAYLKSKIGRLLVETNNYGAVISHIEPEHLENIPIPNPPQILKQTIHNLIEESFKLRDKSNDFMDEAQTLLKKAFHFPDIEELNEKAKQYDKKADLLNYSVPLSDLNNRLDASYHVPIVEAIETHLEKHAQEITTISDSRISQSVILPGRFKRIYVEEGSGITFFGGKQLYELDPSNKKYLSLIHHGDRIKSQLTLHENMTMITCSGTIGKVNIVPEHWEGWTANQHIIRVVPANKSIAGYLYAWLSSDYAYPLITRHTHGAVVDEISDKQVSEIKMPICHDKSVQKKINDSVLNANKKRAKAYELEQEALTILYDKVIYAQ